LIGWTPRWHKERKNYEASQDILVVAQHKTIAGLVFCYHFPGNDGYDLWVSNADADSHARPNDGEPNGRAGHDRHEVEQCRFAAR
jgi:hypothetical protein